MKASRILFALILASLFMLGVEAKTLYFPHYGDGGGISMLFSITNSADSTVTGTLKFYDPMGSPQTRACTRSGLSTDFGSAGRSHILTIIGSV